MTPTEARALMHEWTAWVVGELTRKHRLRGEVGGTRRSENSVPPAEVPGATRAQGDLTGDGFVDVWDFNIFAGDLGCATP